MSNTGQQPLQKQNSIYNATHVKFTIKKNLGPTNHPPLPLFPYPKIY